MSKKRTRKQKQKAKHSFTVKWEPSSSKLKSKANVNRQFPSDGDSASVESKISKRPLISAKDENLVTIKRNILRSLLFSGLILASEVVLYFVWK